MIEIRLPKPGPEIENATITKWESKEGDKIQIGDILAIIKTPIGSFKVAAEEQGILENVLQTEGSSIDFDEPIAIMKPDLTISDFPDLSHQENDDTMELPIDGGETTVTEPESELTEETADEETDAEPEEASSIDKEPQLDEPSEPENDFQEPENEDIPDEISENAQAESIETLSEETKPLGLEESDTPEENQNFEEEVVVSESIKIPQPEVEVSPAARKIAERTNIDLSTIVGTGDNGKILYIDVENVIKQREADAEEVKNTIGTEETPKTDVQEESADLEGENPIEAPLAEEETSGFPPEQDAAEAAEESDESLAEGFKEQETSPEIEKREAELKGHEESEISEADELPSIETVSIPLATGDAEQHDTPQTFEEPHAETESEPIFESDAETESVFEHGNDFKPEPVVEPEPTPESEPVAEQTVEEVETDFEMPEPPQDLPFPDFDEISTQFHISKKDDLIIPFNSTKKAFAEAQIESNRNVPHYYLASDFDITDAEVWLSDYNHKHNARITFTDLFIKATGQSLAMMPEMNAFVRQDRMILKRSINIGLTTSIDEGVVTPVIPDVYHKPLHKVAETVRKNVDLAVKTKVILDYDTTFTISQLKEAGIKRFVPLITTPQTGCLALGSAQKQVVPRDDFIAIRNIIEATLACDARAVDAANASKFLQSIKESIESLKIGNEDPDWIEGNEQLRLI